jgi:hypothetical protein
MTSFLPNIKSITIATFGFEVLKIFFPIDYNNSLINKPVPKKIYPFFKNLRYISETIISMKTLVLFLLIISTLSCQKQSLEPTVYQIDKELQPFVTSFATEAKKRGIEIKYENLIMTFDSSSASICGKCSKQPSEGQRTVKIKRDILCWQGVPNQNKEALVFHELGHCFLNRGHRDDLLPNKAEASLMNSNSYGPYQPCIYAIDGDECDRTYRRTYYIDELFNEKTSIPDWGK